MSIELKTEWCIHGDGIDIESEIASLQRYCVGEVRILRVDFESDCPMGMHTKLEFEVFADTDMNEFWDLVDGVIDEESEVFYE